MSKNTPHKDSQLTLGLSFRNSRFAEYVRYKITKLLILLDEVTFSRLPVLYLVIFIDATLGYWLYFIVLGSQKLPPYFPILYFSPQVDTLTATSDMLNLFFFLLSLHFLSIYVSSRIFYKLRQLSILLLLCCILTSVLFFITVYKSASLSLP